MELIRLLLFILGVALVAVGIVEGSVLWIVLGAVVAVMTAGSIYSVRR